MKKIDTVGHYLVASPDREAIVASQKAHSQVWPPWGPTLVSKGFDTNPLAIN